MARDDDRAHAQRRDFAWKRRKANPFRSKAPARRKITFQLFVIITSLLSSVALLLYHPFFHLRHIEVSGLQRTDSEDFLFAVQGIIDYRVWFLFPKKNFFLFDEKELEDILLVRFPFQTVSIEALFPKTLRITVEEKISTLIYDNGKEYTYVGPDGRVIEPLRHVRDDEWLIETKKVTSTDEFGVEIAREEIIREEHRPAIASLRHEFGRYPIVYDTRKKDTQPQDAVLKEETPDQIFEWFQFLERRSDISFQYMIIDSEIGDAVIKTGEGWDLKILLDKPIERQITELEFALRESIDGKPVHYIDLRYPGRVYWQ